MLRNFIVKGVVAKIMEKLLQCQCIEIIDFVMPLRSSRILVRKRLTFRIHASLLKCIEILEEKIKKYKKEKERKKEGKNRKVYLIVYFFLSSCLSSFFSLFISFSFCPFFLFVLMSTCPFSQFLYSV